MAEWQHAEQALPDIDQTWMVVGPKDRCGGPLSADEMPWLPENRRKHYICGCTTPTPDPASPCGVCNQGTVMCFYTNTHTYQPTRCTCGHAITKEA